MKLIRYILILSLISLAFVSHFAFAGMGNYCSIPPFVGRQVAPNVMLDISVETPMQGAAYPDITCTGDPTSNNYGCAPASCRYTSGGRHISNCYDNSKDYYGYFDPHKCYKYVGSGAGGRFKPVSYTNNHQCRGKKWSGNFLNWATMTAIDAVRKAFTGGNRDVDAPGNTILLRAMQTLSEGHSWFPIKRIDNAKHYTPYSGTIYIVNRGKGFGVCRNPNCNVYFGGTSRNVFNNNGIPTGTSEHPDSHVYNVRVKVCDPSVGLEANCKAYGNNNYKPVGVLQKYSDKMRFGLITYALGQNNTDATNGGVIRANMKWIGPKIPPGLKYHDSSGNLVTCINPNGCPNPEAEINADGTFITNPDNVPGGKSGIINYLNQFGYKQGYKGYDPISEMYYEAIRYFKNKGPTPEYCKFDNGNNIPATDDGFPVYCNRRGLNWRDPILYWCQKNFIVALNDANPWLDKRLPGTYFTSAGDNYDLSGHPDHGEPSNPDTDINVTDLTNQVGEMEGINGHKWCIGCVPGNCDLEANEKIITKLGEVEGTCPWAPKRNSYYIAGLAYYAHTHDLRPDLEGNQTLTTYMIDTQESNPHMLVGRMNMLYLAAKYGGFNDKNGNNEPDLNSEWDKDGDGFPDTYYFASDPSQIEASLRKAFADILKRASSGTAVSVLSTSTRGSGCLAQAYFLPSLTGDNNEELDWVGELKGLWVDPYGQIREDTDASHDASGTNVKAQLELDKDKILKFYNDGTKTVGHTYSSDEYGNVEFPCTPDETKELADFAVIWNAGKKLWETDADNRNIYTSNDGSSLIDFKDSNASTLNPYMRACDDTDAQNIINYVRGKDVDICLDSDSGSCSYTTCNTGHRNRTLTINDTSHVWKLGDIVYSSPRILSRFALGTYDIRYGDDSYREFVSSDNYKNRSDYLFVGANDGMLHCFYLGKIEETASNSEHPGLRAVLEDPENLGPGKELWAYIPMNALPYVKYLAYPDYCHIYYVDQRPLLIDASISTSASKTKDSWRTILIGEMRFGGSPNPPEDSPCIDSNGHLISCLEGGAKKVGLSSIFALDITDPETPKLLWEFSDPDLGFTTSYPAIVRIGSSAENGNWYVVLGSGPTDYNGDQPPNKGYLYVINLRTGELAGKLEIGNNTYGGDCVAVDPDNDYQVDAIYCGTVKKQGHNLTGNILRILTNKEVPTTNGSGVITNWDVTTLIDAHAPVTAAPALALDDQGNLWCYFGTGKYFGETDKTSTSHQYLYGVKDTCWGYNSGSWSYASSCTEVTNIYDTTNVVVSAGQISDWECMCEGGEVETCSNGDPAKDRDTNGNPICNCGEMVVTKVTGVTVSGCGGSDGEDWQSCANRIADNYDGWKITLNVSDSAERVISQPSVIGQLAMFTTFTPNADVCGFGGNSSLYSLYYKAGIPYKQPSIIGEEAYQSGILKKSVNIGQGSPAIGESIVSKKVGKKLKTYIQLSTGKVKEVTNQPVFIPDNIQFWIER